MAASTSSAGGWTAALLAVSVLVSANAQAPSEYQVKAAFLYNFTKFVEWPQTGSDPAGTSISIGILGQNPFGATLEGIIKGKSLDGRPLVLRQLKKLDEARNCQIVFVSAGESKRIGKILESLKGAPVLTVGDSRGFAESGGMINFIVEDSSVRFEINPDAARESGLKISSKLLSLAKIVRTKASYGSN
jgi:hypothetical protein